MPACLREGMTTPMQINIRHEFASRRQSYHIYIAGWQIGIFLHNVLASQGETAAIPGPAVERQNLPPALLLFAKVLGHAPANLRESRPHHFSECSLSER